MSEENQKNNNTIVKNQRISAKMQLQKNPRVQSYNNVMTKNHLRLTADRLVDFRQTLKEIVDVKNGKFPTDFEDLKFE